MPRQGVPGCGKGDVGQRATSIAGAGVEGQKSTYFMPGQSTGK